MPGPLITQLPRWVVNTLRRIADSGFTWRASIQVDSQEFKDGYEMVSLLTPQGRVMQIRRVTGKLYADRALMCCFECRRTTSQLAKVDIHNQHLRACRCSECRVLLCVHCTAQHETLHELAGEAMVNPWSRAEVAEHKWREEKK